MATVLGTAGLAACAATLRWAGAEQSSARLSGGQLKAEEEKPPEPGSPEWWGKAEWRAREYLKTMSPEDKFAFVNGQDDKWPYHRHGYAGYINTQMSLPGDKAAYGSIGTAMPLALNDGPQGYNSYGAYPGTSTQFPALISVAASFSEETSEKYARAVAEEFAAKGANVLLGPDVEVQRAPLTGRSFETVAGEDPHLGSQLVRPFVRAIQEHGIIVTVKHWLDNNQEIYRQTMNAIVDDRAQHEIYMPVFAAAFEAGAGSVMCSYNKVNGVHACENKELLTKLLRDELGFKGYVVSDWGATHDAQSSAEAGLDVEMQGGKTSKFAQIPDLVSSGAITQEMVDEKVVHVLTAMYAVGQFDGKFPAPEQYMNKNLWDLDKENDVVISADVTTDEHRQAALEVIFDSSVLLKNKDATLPIEPKGKKIAMIGKYCKQKMDEDYGQGSVYSGGGSGYVQATDEKVISPLDGVKGRFQDAASFEWSADASAGDGADVAVVCLSVHSEEGWDRKDFSVPEADDLIKALRKQDGDKKIVVLLIVPGAVTTEWVKDVDAVLTMFMPGEQVGVAAAQLLAGDAAPGGRLPISFPKADEKRFENSQYPGECPAPEYWCEQLQANFSEGVLIGYRWNDAMKVPSAYPFGFGLTYTTFELKDFSAECDGDDQVTVSLKVANTGSRLDAAVPQVYIGFPSLKPALRQLRAFKKVWVEAGKTADLTFSLGPKDWRYYDKEQAKWVTATEKGEHVTISVGTSSTDLQWHKTLGCGVKAEE